MMGSSVHQADHLTTISAQCLQVALGSSKFARSRRPSAVWSPQVSTHTRRPGPFLITSLPVQRHRGEPGHRSFLTHHVANISTAIQTADAQTILNAASARMLRVSFGVM